MNLMNILSAELGNWPDANMVWAMVHTLWQGAVVAGLLWVFLRLLPVRFAGLRYSGALACLFALPILGMVTWSVLDHGGWSWPRIEHMRVGISWGQIAASPQENISVDARGGTRLDWTIWAGRIWLAGAIFMSLRAAVRTALMQRKIAWIQALTEGEVFEQVNRLCRQMGIRRRIKIVVWEQMRIPAVAGFFFPILLLPAEIVLQCPAGQLQMILAHELAHVRRWDFLMNFVQQILEAILFFNPAMWWISRQVRFEREACSDAWAVAVTGQPVLAVRTLARFAYAVSGLPVQAINGASGTMLDRIRRILRPQDRARVAVPWYAATAGLACAVLLLCALRVGADVMVDATLKFLTPAQVTQLDQMQQAQDASPSTARKVDLRGLVRTADESALPQALIVNIQERLGNETIGRDAPVDQTGHFGLVLDAGELQFALQAPGFAPAFLGPIHPGADGNYPQINLLLNRGFPARILIVDAGGKPVPHVKAAISYTHGFVIGRHELITDEKGIAIAENVSSDFPATIEITAPGFEYQKTDLTLQPNQDNRLSLVPEAMVSGTVVDAHSGNAISGATIQQMWRNGYQPSMSLSGVVPPTLATTDSAGHFVLHSLRDDSDYGILVSAPEHGSAIYSEIRAGTTGLTWKLGSPAIIHGRVTGDLSRLRGNYADLPVNSYAIFMQYRLYVLSSSSYEWSVAVPVKVSGGVGTFEIDNPLPGALTLVAGNNSVTVNTDDIPALVELHVDTESERPKVAKRTVVLQFDLPPGAPSPGGSLGLSYSDPDRGAGMTGTSDVPVQNGTASFEVPAPGQVTVGQGELIGCYLTSAFGPPIDVPAGSTPLVIKVRAIPAGAVHGHVSVPDGSPAASFAISAIEIARSPLLPQNMGLSIPTFNPRDTSGNYLLGALPLGGTYRLLAWSADRYVLSGELKPGGGAALSEENFQFAQGQTVHVAVTGSDGKPRAGVRLSLNFSFHNSRFVGDASHTTGSDGTAVIDHVNPNIDGEYSIQIQPGFDYSGVQKSIKIDGNLVTIRLARGVALKGMVLDDTTGKSLPRHGLRVMPRDGNGMNVETTTDADGKFDFENLEEKDYQLIVDGSFPAGSQPVRGPDGKITGWRYPDDWQEATLVRGGQAVPAVVRVIPTP